MVGVKGVRSCCPLTPFTKATGLKLRRSKVTKGKGHWEVFKGLEVDMYLKLSTHR